MTLLTNLALSKVPLPLRRARNEWLGFVPCWDDQLGPFQRVVQGSRSAITIHPSELFAPLLRLRPSGFFLFHNHPSGSLIPSWADLHLTERVEEVAALLQTPLLGHAILTRSESAWIPLADWPESQVSWGYDVRENLEEYAPLPAV